MTKLVASEVDTLPTSASSSWNAPSRRSRLTKTGSRLGLDRGNVTMGSSDIAGTVWLVTGAAAGFGKAICDEVLERGGKVVATARDPNKLADIVALAPDRSSPSLWTSPLKAISRTA